MRSPRRFASALIIVLSLSGVALPPAEARPLDRQSKSATEEGWSSLARWIGTMLSRSGTTVDSAARPKPRNITGADGLSPLPIPLPIGTGPCIDPNGIRFIGCNQG
jgi:hypothetical protein